MENVKEFFTKTWVWVILLSLPAGWALLVPGFYGASDDMHIGWFHQMDRAISMGQIPPRLAPDLSFGFSYPLFNFLFPLPFYIAEIFHLLSLGLVDSIKAVFFISIILSALGMYWLLKELVKNRGLALAGALIYVYTPYRAVDLYIRGAIGEIVSFAILPLVALSVVKLTSVENSKRINYRWLGIGGVAFSSLVLSHNITAYMFLPFIFLLGFLRIFLQTKKWFSLVGLMLTVFLGLLISLYFWLPAIVESVLMKYDTVFNFVDHFPTLRQLITPHWGYGASVPGPYDGMPFFIGTINLGLVIIGVPILAISWRGFSPGEKVVLIWAYLVLAVSVMMMNHRSSPLWQNLPLLPYFQFPWRFLIMVTFITPLLIMTLGKLGRPKIMTATLIGLVIVLNISNFRPEDFLGRGDDYYLKRYIPVPVANEEYLQIQEEYFRLPKDTQLRPDKNYPLVSAKGGDIKNIIKRSELDVVIETSALNPMIINFNKYFFPGWQAEIDGQQAAIIPGKPFGQITLKVPPGEHQVKISFTETNFKKVLDIMSLSGLLLALWWILNPHFKKFKL